MNINELLGKHPCSCGRTHACAIAQVHIERGAVSHLKELCENFETVAVAADGLRGAGVQRFREKALQHQNFSAKRAFGSRRNVCG